MNPPLVPEVQKPLVGATADQPTFAGQPKPDVASSGRSYIGGGKWRPYLRIARVDHWIKNVFMLPGVTVGLLFVRPPVEIFLWHVVIGLASLCLVASANYTINEYLDSEFDRFHPSKKDRAGAQGLLD